MRSILSKKMRSAGVLSGILVALLAGTAPVTAQQTICHVNYRTCQQHCMQAKNTTSWTRCRHRICGPRFDRCLADHGTNTASQTAYVLIPAKPRIPRGENAPRPAPPVYNPTGPIVPEGRFPPPPSTGNGGIVPRDRMPTGNIVPAGQNQRTSSDKR